MKNYRCLIFALFTLLYSSCTDDEFYVVEEEMDHEAFKSKYGFRAMNSKDLINPDSIMHFNSVQEADDFLSENPILGMDGQIPGYSEIEVTPLNGEKNARYPINQGGGDQITLTWKVSNFTSYNLRFNVRKTLVGGQYTISEEEVSVSFSGLMLTQGIEVENVIVSRVAGGSFEIKVQFKQTTAMFLKDVQVTERLLDMKATYNPYTKQGEINSIIDQEYGPIHKNGPDPNDFNPFGTNGTGPVGYGTSGSGGSSGGSGYGTGGGSRGINPGYSGGVGKPGFAPPGGSSGSGGKPPGRPNNPSPKEPCGTSGGGTAQYKPCDDGLPPIARSYTPKKK